MAEIRFPLRGRTRRGAHAADPVDPLAEMAGQIRELDEAAERVAERISAAAASLRDSQIASGSATRTDLLAGLASALVDRTDEIRTDCAELAALMDRTAKLVGERDAAEVPSAPPPAPQSIPPPGQPPAELRLPEPAEPEPELAEELQGVEAAIDPPVDPLPYPGMATERLSDHDGAGGPAGTSEGVRLIATQMAIAGSSRTEIERRLRIQFGVRDADGALDEIFGVRSGPG